MCHLMYFPVFNYFMLPVLVCACWLFSSAFACIGRSRYYTVFSQWLCIYHQLFSVKVFGLLNNINFTQCMLRNSSKVGSWSGVFCMYLSELSFISYRLVPSMLFKLVHGCKVTYFVALYLYIGCTTFNDKNYEWCNWNNVEVLLKSEAGWLVSRTGLNNVYIFKFSSACIWCGLLIVTDRF
jgi:hypothetical protein